MFPDLGKYKLQGSEIYKILDPKVYDTRLFFRPPFFIYFSAMFYPLTGNKIFYILPALEYFGLIILMYETVFFLTKSDKFALKSLYLTALSPFLLFHVFKIWMDLCLTFLVFAGFCFAVLSKMERYCKLMIFLSGLSLTLAMLTKYQAVIILPLVVYILIYSHGITKVFGLLKIFFVPFSLVFIWLIYLAQYHPTLQYLTSNTPTSEELVKFPFVRRMADRPGYYYFISLFMVNPVYLLLSGPVVRLKNIHIGIIKYSGLQPVFAAIYVFAVVMLMVFTFIAAKGSTYQSRYILMIHPFFIFLMTFIPLPRNFMIRTAFILGIIYSLFILSLNISLQSAELFSLPELLGR
jgi:4-amino-4-deoxy-L-arabinose transferase-like glycosyltransferase